MVKKSKVQTPAWILEGYDSPAEYAKSMQKNKSSTSSNQSGDSSTKAKGVKQGAKKEIITFKVRKCPKCGSDDVGLVLSNSDAEEGGGKEWGCRKCKWKGIDIVKKELTEDELMKYLDEKGEEI